MEWKEDLLGNLIDALIDYRGKTPKKQSFGIPLITAKIIKNGSISEPTEFISEDQYHLWMTRGFPVNGDVILTTEAPLGEVAQLDFRKVALAQRVVCFRGKKNMIDNTYLKYYFLSYYGQQALRARETGTTVTGIKQSELKKVIVKYPSFLFQRKIAGILSALDSKIENNNKINANLEAQAQALFKSWFVDFTPFKDQPFVDSELGPIPQGWKVGKLGDYVEIKRGGSPRPIQKFLASQGLNWLKISDATSTQSPFIFNIKEKIIIDGLKKTVFLKAGSLVLSNSATPCIPKFLSIDSCIHDGWLYFPHSQLPENYLYLFFKLMRNNLVSKANGSVFLNLKTDIVKNQVFAFSGEEIYNSFDKIIAPLFKEIENLTYETFQLSALRDTLLPKLMSGEIKL